MASISLQISLFRHEKQAGQAFFLPGWQGHALYRIYTKIDRHILLEHGTLRIVTP